jgi:hypothetical protein
VTDNGSKGTALRRGIALLLVVFFLLFALALLGTLSSFVREPRSSTLLENPSFWCSFMAVAYGAFSVTHSSWFKGRGVIAGGVGILVVSVFAVICWATLRSMANEAAIRAERIRVEANAKIDEGTEILRTMVAALVAFDPDTKIPAIEEIAASAKSGKFDVQRDGGRIAAMFQEALPRALARTTDDALLGYLEAYTQMLDEMAKISVETCVATVFGDPDLQTMIRAMESVDPGTQGALRSASVRVLMEAKTRSPALKATAKEVEALLNPMSVSLKASNIDINVLRGGTSGDAKSRCDAYRAVSHLTLQLAEPGRSRLARVLILGQ